MGLSKDMFKFSFSRFCQFPQRDVQSGLPQQQIVTSGAEHPVALVRNLLVSHYDSIGISVASNDIKQEILFILNMTVKQNNLSTPGLFSLQTSQLSYVSLLCQ